MPFNLICKHLSHSFSFTLYFSMLVAGRIVVAADEGFLSGFDTRSREYVQKERARLAEILKSDEFGDDVVNYMMSHMLHYLLPFCTDLRPYKDQCSQEEKDKNGYAGTGLMAEFLRPEWLPPGWLGSQASEKEAIERRAGLSEYHRYLRVPKTLYPSPSWPGKTGSLVEAWVIRKGGFSCTMQISWTDRVIVLHEDKGFGNNLPNERELGEIRDRYLRLPPDDLRLPKGWSAIFVLDHRAGRFHAGRMVSLVDGKRPKQEKSTRAWNSWNDKAPFYYDGYNFAFVLRNWHSGRIDEPLQVALPDIDWDKEYPKKGK